MTAVAASAGGRDEPEPPIAAPPPAPLSSVLARELAAGPWEHAWDLAPGVVTPVRDPSARHADWTLDAMLEEPVRDALALVYPGDRARALVVSGGEGRIAQRLLEWGAGSVVVLEGDPALRRRAELLREHFAWPSSALDLRADEGLDALAAGALGTFDIVVVAEDPRAQSELNSLLARARACTRSLCAIAGGRGGRVLSAVAAREAGFARVELAEPPAEGERRWVSGERSLLLARPERGP